MTLPAYVTTSEVRRMRELRAAGLYFIEIAQITGRDRNTVMRHASDVKPKPCPRPTAKVDIDEMWDLIEAKVPTAQIARHFGVSPQNIRYHRMRWLNLRTAERDHEHRESAPARDQDVVRWPHQATA